MKQKSLVFVAAALVAHAANAADPEFMDFVLKQAHERGFTRCDAAIKDAFQYVGGSDIRVITQMGSSADHIKIIAVWGKTGDAVYSEAEFRRAEAKCQFTITSVMSSPRSCTAELGSLPAFRFEAETSGVTFTVNSGGVNMILMPVGAQGCTSIFLRDGEV